MSLFTNPVDRLQESLSKVFTPASPISQRERLKGREELLEDIRRAYRREGSGVVLYGERGVGKTSVAKVALNDLAGSHYYYSASATDTFESIVSSVLANYGAEWQERSKESLETTKKDAKLSIPVASGGLGHERQTKLVQQRLGETHLSPQEIANRLPKQEGLIIIDDFERIQSSDVRAQFADLVKKLSDNHHPATVMLVGVADNIGDILSAHESARRNIMEVRVPRLTQSDIRRIVSDGVRQLQITIDDDSLEQIAEFSAQFPYYTHLLCEGAVTSLITRVRKGEQQDLHVAPANVRDAILYAIRNTEYSISHAYEEATRSITDSPRFKYTLYAIASWPKEPVSYRDIAKWVGGLVKVEDLNVSHQLKRLESAAIIERLSPGFYRFRNPILKAFVMLKVRSDTPTVELAEIDAQLKQVQKRIDRVTQRI
ncbi:MAG TPA: ATP-binding protein [Syntrophorhabdales bacterium]|nr:ATP-binding protein [Syntrophorhabdales bacterium]